jgi:hypothetical protein
VPLIEFRVQIPSLKVKQSFRSAILNSDSAIPVVDPHFTLAMTSNSTRRHADEVLSQSQPVRVLHSQLTYRRGYSNLACSQTNILVATKKPTPSSCSIEAITGNTYTNKSQPKRTPLLLAQQYHGHYAITHMEWNQRGNYLATIDETGRLAIWEQSVSLRIQR